jgi:SAM-dependent methyltransferase
MGVGNVPVDWYRSSLAGKINALFWEEGAEERVALALRCLEPDGRERVLDLACATGQRTLELSRRGFCVVGTDIDEFLLEVGGCEAEREDLYPLFSCADPRELAYLREFDLVLSLGGGAFGYFEHDSEDLLILQRVAQALRPEGRLLMQVPNLLHVEAHLPESAWIFGAETAELIEHAWNAQRRRIEGTITSMVDGEASPLDDPIPFQRRVYSVEELAQAFESVGMELVDVFDEAGAPCAPTDRQQELFVEARF